MAPTALLIVLTFAAADAPSQIDGHATVAAAKQSKTPVPISLRAPWGKDRDLAQQPLKLAVFLVEFSDRKHEAPHTREFYENMIFSRGVYKQTPSGNPVFGSINEWYDVQSHGRCRLTGRVFDWVAVDDTFEAIHALKGAEAREHLLIAAMDKVKARDGFVFNDYDAIVFFHAGPITGPPGNILWSHRFVILGKSDIVTGEIEANGVLCHEFGHMFGLPDLYGTKDRVSIGPWCAMSGGYRGKYPRSFCAWSKARLGWCTPTVIDAAMPQKLVLRPIQHNPNDALIIPLSPGLASGGAGGGDFLMLENRDTSGNDEESQPGLFIWRITRTMDKGKDSFVLKLIPPPAPAGAKADKDRVTWPRPGAAELTIPAESGAAGIHLTHIRKVGDNVFFEIAPR